MRNGEVGEVKFKIREEERIWMNMKTTILIGPRKLSYDIDEEETKMSRAVIVLRTTRSWWTGYFLTSYKSFGISTFTEIIRLLFRQRTRLFRQDPNR